MMRIDPPAVRRPGFTLIELLVVIAIIATLVGLLMAGVMKVRERANEVKAQADISQLNAAAGTFKTTFKVNRIQVFGGAGANGANPERRFRLRNKYPSSVSGFPLDVPDSSLEVQFLRQMFPNMNVAPATGNGLPNLDLDPNQAMVFFLGGYFFQTDGGSNNRQVWMQGYLSDPVNPFLHTTTSTGFGTIPNGAKPPFFDFAKSAASLDFLVNQFDAPGLVQLNATAADQAMNATNCAPHFLDPWGTPYLFFSANGNRGYYESSAASAFAYAGMPLRTAAESPASGLDSNKIQYYKDNSRGTLLPLQVSNLSKRPSAFAYLIQPFKSSTKKFVNDSTFVIVSAGRDKWFGPGGEYRGAAAADYGMAANSGGDDLTNFAQSRLGAGD